MTTPTAAEVAGKGIEIGLLQGVAQARFAIPKPQSASPERRIAPLDSSQVPDSGAKASVLVMHYDMGTLD